MTEHIIAISKFTATSLNRVLRISRGRIHTIPLCADTILLPEQPDLPRDWAGPFAFYPANDLPHKNHRGLFDALQRLQDTGVDIPLILTGDRRMELLDVKSITDEYGLQAHVLDLGHVSCAQLSWLYKNAKMLVFPSRFEGFGLPVLEAMQHELPVTCSGTTSLPEVGGEAALYFDPNRPEDMAEKIGRLWLDHVLRDNLRNAGRLQAAQFTAERMVKAHRDVFISAVHSRTKKRWHPFSIAWEPRRAGPLQRQYRRAQHLLRDSRTGK
jgi:glycosyltransferase involved in cell wall biosynthesis